MLTTTVSRKKRKATAAGPEQPSPKKPEAEDRVVVEPPNRVVVEAPRYRTRDRAVEYIKNTHGVPLSESTADKLAALGEFAEPAAYWGNRPLYTDLDLDAWVESRLRRRGGNDLPAATDQAINNVG
jgi:hypothetical protein